MGAEHVSDIGERGLSSLRDARNVHVAHLDLGRGVL